MNPTLNGKALLRLDPAKQKFHKSIQHSAHLKEWIDGSGVDPEIAKLNVESIFSPSQIARRLGWAKYRHDGGWWCQGVKVATGEPSGFGQFKPRKPFRFEDRKAKYLTPKGAYDAIALQMPEADYWQTIAANHSTPVILTEGAKKAAAALSCGFPALALVGVEMGLTGSDGGSKQRELVPNVAALAVPGRVFVLGLDMDLGQKRPVREALRTLARALKAKGCTVLVASWDEQHKGLDDLLVNCGADAVSAAIDGAEEFSQWDKQWRAIESAEQLRAVLSCTLEPEMTLNQRYLDAAALPELAPSEILAISSAVGTGKTEALKALVAAHRAKHPEAWVLFVGYRNSLLHQTGQRLGLPHIQSLERDYPNNLGYGLKQEGAALLCLDSLHKIPWDNLPQNSLLIFDEAEATASHGLSGGTLGDRQNEILQLWQSVCNRLLATGGKIVLAEDSLTDIGLNFYQQLTGDQYPIRLVRNDWRPECSTTLSTSGSSGFVAQLLAELGAGQKIIVPTDSQAFGEKLARLAETDGCKVFRLDSKTAELPECKAFQSNPNGYIERHRPDLIVLSPTAESGVSIDVKGFHVRANLTSSDTRRQFQLLSRVRNPESVEILTKPSGILSDTDWQTSPKALMKQQAIATRHTALLSGIEQELSAQSWSSEAQAALKALESTLKGEDKAALFWMRHRANFKARENLLKQGMAENLENYLKARGFTVETISYERCKLTAELFKQAGEDIEAETAQRLFELPGGQSEAAARSILSSGSATYSQRLNAQKSLLEARLPGANLTEDFLLQACVKDRGKALRSAVLLWNSRNPHIAKKLDRASFKSQLSKAFVLGWRLSHHAQKADLFQQSGLEAVIALSGSATELSEADPIVQQVKAWAINNSASIWRNFRLNVKPEQTGIEILSKLLRRFGHKLTAARRVGARGDRQRLWIVKSNLKPEHQAEIFEALNRKWADDLSQSEQAVSTIFNPTKPSIKTVDTKPDPPPKPSPYKAGDTVLFVLDGSECRVERVKGELIELRRLDEFASTLKFDALPSDLRAIA